MFFGVIPQVHKVNICRLICWADVLCCLFGGGAGRAKKGQVSIEFPAAPQIDFWKAVLQLAQKSIN